MRELTDITAEAWSQYAMVGGYDFRFFNFEKSASRHPSWLKLVAAKECLEDGYSQVFWADADSIPVKRFSLPADPFADWFSAVDGNGLCNSHMLINRTVDAIRFLDVLLFLGNPRNYSVYHTARKHEQDTIKTLMYEFPRVDELIRFFHEGFIHHGAFGLDDSNIWHLPCISNKERVELFKSRIVSGQKQAVK